MTLQDFINLKRKPIVSALESSVFGLGAKDEPSSVIVDRTKIKSLYTLALANINRDDTCVDTVYAIEKITKGDASFTMIRKTLGSPKKIYFGMNNLKNWS